MHTTETQATLDTRHRTNKR